MFKKILIANRGEIAVRIVNACHLAGIKAITIYSDVEGQASHVQLADESYELKGQPAGAYLDIDQIVSVAKECEAEAIHPGYGFLSEMRSALSKGQAIIGREPART